MTSQSTSKVVCNTHQTLKYPLSPTIITFRLQESGGWRGNPNAEFNPKGGLCSVEWGMRQTGLSETADRR